MKLTFSADYEAYISEYLMTIKSNNDNKYHMLTNKNSKLLFYHFNDNLYRQVRQSESVKHSINAKDEFGLLRIWPENWPQFIEKILNMSEKENYEQRKTNQ